MVEELSNRYNNIALHDNENTSTVTRCQQQKKLKIKE
jgi:hypothetical protein